MSKVEANGKQELVNEVRHIQSCAQRIHDIHQQLEFYHGSPIGPKMTLFFLTFFNFALVSLFFAVGTVIGPYGAIVFAAVTLLFIRGSIITKKLNQYFLQQKITKYEEETNRLLREKQEIVEQFTKTSALSERYLSVEIWKQALEWVEKEEETSFQSCIQRVKEIS